ncbi:MAG: M20/M25/M40 family metallo-hydrolase [Actinobacteria bacterium]|nr:M20/M25/M40 family metallo-hydrolase [Actinomycetota bacterium]
MIPHGLAVEEAERVVAGVEADLPLLLRDLEAWVNIDTPSEAVEQLDRLSATLARTVEQYGLHPELVPMPGVGLSLYASLHGKGRAKLALLCHHDTVFPLGTTEGWPFSHDDNRVYGPGVADMKGGIAVAVHAARLMATGPRPFGLVEVISVPDEETRPTAPEEILEHVRGYDAVLCMECGRVDGSIVSARKGGRWFRIHATGRPAHAGVEPDTGRNVAMALAQEALRLGALHHAREGMTFQVTELHAGQGVNTVPGDGFLTGDMRALTSAELEWGMEEMQRFGSYPDIVFREEDLGGPPPLERTPEVAALAETAIMLGERVGHRFGESMTGGVSDGSWTAWSGVPTLDGLGPVGGLDHTPAEYAELATFAARAGVVAGLVAAVDAGLLGG